MNADIHLTKSQAVSLLDNLPGNFLAFTSERQIIFASAGYARLMGMGKEQLEGNGLMDNLPKGLEEYGAHLQEIAEEVKMTQEEVSRLVSGTQPAPAGLWKAFCWRVSCKPLTQVEEQTYLVHIEEDAEDHKGRYCLLQESGHIIVWDWDKGEQLTWRSDGFFSMLGIDRTGPLDSDPRLWENLLHPDEAREVLKSIRGAFASGEREWQAEYRLRHACGSYIVVADRARILYDGQGHAIRMVGTTIDVTERREKELETEKQQEMLDALPIMAWAAKPDGGYTYYNKRWWDYFYTSDESWTLEQWGELMHPEDRIRTVDQWAESLATGTPYSMRLRWRAHTGAPYRWFQAYAVPVKDAANEIKYWMGATVDTQEQEEAQALLEEEKTAFQFLADVVPHMVWRTDANGFHNYFNKRWVEYTGYDVESSLGTEMWNNLLHPEDQERARRVWTHSLETGDPYEIEYRFKRASDGIWRWFLARALPLRNETGEIVQWYGTCTDIEDKKHTERLLEGQKQALELINQDLDRFVHMIGHDLKLPLVNMGALFDALTETVNFDTNDSEQLVSHFRKSHKNMTSTLSDLMELARLQRSAQDTVTKVSLRGVIDEVLESLGNLVSSSHAEVSLKLDKPEIFFYSKANLRSVLHNLLSNAIKYRHPDRRPRIEIKSGWEEGFLQLTVSDNGLGMDLERDGKKLFGAFNRLHSHTEGSGLGLYIVKRVVEISGGQVSVSSKEDKGTIFTIKLRSMA